MKILDLFCCCGGVSTGLYNNGLNDITGVDIGNDHKYPFKFMNKDVFDLPLSFFDEFDFIWASPPCQQFSIGSKRWLNLGYQMPLNLIPQTRDLILKTGKPGIIENVPNAPLRKDLILCGEMFDNQLNIVRHRIFELIKCKVPQPLHKKHKPTIINKRGLKRSAYCQIAGHGGDSCSYDLKSWQKAIGINWVNDKNHLVEMIPPLYSNYIINNISF